jgi:hypothetical protein
VKTLSPRELRRVWACAAELFKPKSLFVPQSFEEWRAVTDMLSRELRLTNNREVLLTDEGLALFQRTVAMLDEFDISEGLASYSDVSTACRHVLQDCLSDGLVPEDGAEFIKLFADKLDPKIGIHTYVVPLFGVELDGIDEVPLGSLMIRRPSKELIIQLGVENLDERLDLALEQMKPYLWMMGAAEGTAVVSKERFVAQCRLACGLLAIVVASMYERGAHGFRIGVITSPEEAHGRAVSMSWTDAKRELIVHLKSVRAQPFKINADLAANISHSPVGRIAFRVLEAANRTALESAWVKAVFWYSDAHRDQTPVMRLLKFWSCAEVFFSGDRRDITESVSFGLAASLVYRSEPFVDPRELEDLKKRLKRMYGERSEATHQASHSHVSDKDVADLSQWIAWMLFSMVAFIAAGLPTPQDVLAALRQSAGVADKPAPNRFIVALRWVLSRFRSRKTTRV